MPIHSICRVCVLLLLALLLTSCGDDADLTGPSPVDSSTGFEADPIAGSEPVLGPQTTTGVPSALSASRTFEVEGDASCCQLPGGPYARFGVRYERPVTGPVTISSTDGTLTCNEPPEDPDRGMQLDLGDHGFAWTSGVPVGAVLVSNGVRTRVYVYSPRSWGDSGLRAPLDTISGSATAITAVSFCYDYALSVSTRPDARLVSRVQWELGQTLHPEQWDLLPGDRATSRAEVVLERTGQVDEPPTVVGAVTVRNDSPLRATLASATNLLGTVVPLSWPVALPHELAPGEEIVATYFAQLTDASPRLNYVSVNTMGEVLGGSARANVTFGERELVNGAVHLRNVDGTTWGPFETSVRLHFDRELDCSLLQGAAERAVTQETTIVETGQRASSSIVLRCWSPALVPSVDTSFTRRWKWDVAVELSAYQLALPADATARVGGVVRASASHGAGQDYRATGAVEVVNTHPARALTLTGLDLQVGERELVVDTSQNSTIGAGTRASFAVELELLDGTRVSAWLRLRTQSSHFLPDGTVIPLKDHETRSKIDLMFGEPTTEVDAQATLHDTHLGSLGTVRADAGSVEMPLGFDLGPYPACAGSQFAGAVELVPLDSGLTSTAPYSLTIEVACGDGCTRGSGYWRGHASGRTGHVDPAWSLLPRGPRTPLFGSGFSWLDALDRAPRGDAYLLLARAWVTARLNVMAGAPGTAVDDALDRAEAMLRSFGPGGLPAETRRSALALFERLQAFNEGEIGPGGCDD